MNLLELMLGIRNLDLVLPEFQREYVWEKEQAKQLMVSLFKDYPTGSLLFWKTQDPPEIKNNAINRERIGSTSVILDGQQRLTTLFLLTQNEIPPYYTSKDIKTDPRNLYFDIESGDFQYYQKQRMENNRVWIPVIRCFSDKSINPFKIATQRSDDSNSHFALAQQFNENLNRLRNIMERVYPVQTVPSTAGIDDAIDVFDRVNSLGTKLTDAELALAHICGKWSQARQEMKSYIAHLESQHFNFPLTFMVRCLAAVVQGRALFETLHDVSGDDARKGWDCVKKTLDYLTAILPKYGYIHSTEDLNTTNVVVPLVAHVAKCSKFPSDAAIRMAIHWLYAANAWGRYSGQTDQRLDHDISIIQRTDNPWPDLVAAIVDQRGRIELAPDDLEGRGSGHPFYRMTYIMAKARGAVDWCNGLPLDIKQKGAYSLHSHHIFPQSRLYAEGGYRADNHLHKKIVNEIANRAFLTADSNWTLCDDRPENYFQEVRDKYPGAMEKQFVPTASGLWGMDKYEDFLRQRRKLIAKAFNTLMKALLEETKDTEIRAATDLIRDGESPILEFKSSLRWDRVQRCANKQLRKVVAKTICGFLNSEGGTLLIGVSDDGVALGLQEDIDSLGRKDRDGFIQELTQILSTYLGDSVAPYVHSRFELVNGVEICRVDIDASPSPIFLSDGANQQFYIRHGSSTKPLEMEEMIKYSGEKWG